MQPEQPLIAPTLMGRGGDGAENGAAVAGAAAAACCLAESSGTGGAAAAPAGGGERAFVRRTHSVDGAIDWQARSAVSLEEALFLCLVQSALVGPMAVAVVVESGRCERGRQSGWTAG